MHLFSSCFHFRALLYKSEKFVDQYGYADGVLHMIMKQSLTGESPHNDTKNQEVTPIVILFDPDYTE